MAFVRVRRQKLKLLLSFYNFTRTQANYRAIADPYRCISCPYASCGAGD